jgi:hypothetical protein
MDGRLLETAAVGVLSSVESDLEQKKIAMKLSLPNT